MSSAQGSNGVLDGRANVRRFETWQREVLDFRPYMRHGKLNVSRIAEHCGFRRDVFRTNPHLRDVLLPALRKLLEDGQSLHAKAPAALPSTMKPERAEPRDEVLVSKLMAQNEAYRAEIAALRRELQRLTTIDVIFFETGRLPW